MTDSNTTKDDKRRERIVKTLLFGGVVALPLCIGIVNLVAFLVIAAQNPDDRVADDFYKKALGVHKNAEPNKLALERGISASMNYFVGDNVLEVQLLGEYGSTEQLALDLIHGVDATQDQRIVLQATSEGNFTAPYSGSLNRFAQLRLQPVSTETTWSLNRAVSAAQQVDVAGQALWKLTL